MLFTSTFMPNDLVNHSNVTWRKCKRSELHLKDEIQQHSCSL